MCGTYWEGMQEPQVGCTHALGILLGSMSGLWGAKSQDEQTWHGDVGALVPVQCRCGLCPLPIWPAAVPAVLHKGKAPPATAWGTQ